MKSIKASFGKCLLFEHNEKSIISKPAYLKVQKFYGTEVF